MGWWVIREWKFRLSIPNLLDEGNQRDGAGFPALDRLRIVCQIRRLREILLFTENVRRIEEEKLPFARTPHWTGVKIITQQQQGRVQIKGGVFESNE